MAWPDGKANMPFIRAVFPYSQSVMPCLETVLQCDGFIRRFCGRRRREKTSLGWTIGAIGVGFLSREGREGGEVRRAGIVVENQPHKFKSSVRSDIMVAVRKDYAAPTGLEFGLGWDSTNMPRLRRW
jgi:hypothetical protein